MNHVGAPSYLQKQYQKVWLVIISAITFACLLSYALWGQYNQFLKTQTTMQLEKDALAIDMWMAQQGHQLERLSYLPQLQTFFNKAQGFEQAAQNTEVFSKLGYSQTYFYNPEQRLIYSQSNQSGFQSQHLNLAIKSLKTSPNGFALLAEKGRGLFLVKAAYNQKMPYQLLGYIVVKAPLNMMSSLWDRTQLVRHHLGQSLSIFTAKMRDAKAYGQMPDAAYNQTVQALKMPNWYLRTTYEGTSLSPFFFVSLALIFSAVSLFWGLRKMQILQGERTTIIKPTWQKVVERVVDSTHDLIVVTDHKYMIQAASPAVESVFGYSAEALVGQSIRLLFAKGSVPLLESDKEAVAIIDAKGATCDVQYTQRQINSHSLFHRFEDESEKWQFEAAQKQNARARDFLEVSCAWQWELDHSGRITYLSEHICTLLGKPLGMLMEKHFVELTLFADFTHEYKQITTAIHDRREIKEIAFSFKDSSKEIRKYKISGKPTFDNQGNCLGFRGVAILDKQPYIPPHQSEMTEKVEKVKDLVRLQLQPIMPLDRSAPQMYEGLTELRTASGKHIKPAAYLPVMEKKGGLAKVDYLALKHLFKRAAQSQEIFSVNLSVESLQDADFWKKVTTLLAETSAKSEQILFEIAQSFITERFSETKDFIMRARKHGFKVGLDQCVEERALHAFLRHCQVDYIKIDRKLIKRISELSVRSQIAAMIREGHAHNCAVIACGVETAQDFIYLESLGIDLVQGYYLAAPQLAS